MSLQPRKQLKKKKEGPYLLNSCYGNNQSQHSWARWELSPRWQLLTVPPVITERLTEDERTTESERECSWSTMKQ